MPSLRLWRCPVCGHTWPEKPSGQHYLRIMDVPKGEGCPGVPVEFLAFPATEARKGWVYESDLAIEDDHAADFLYRHPVEDAYPVLIIDEADDV